MNGDLQTTRDDVVSTIFNTTSNTTSLNANQPDIYFLTTPSSSMKRRTHRRLETFAEVNFSKSSFGSTVCQLSNCFNNQTDYFLVRNVQSAN